MHGGHPRHRVGNTPPPPLATCASLGSRGEDPAESSSPRGVRVAKRILHPSSFPGMPTRQSRAVYKKSFIRHASSPNSSWKSFRLWMMSPASARCASLDPTALRLGTRQFLLFMYSCSARARRVSDEGRKRKVRKKRVTFPRHDVSGGLGRRVGSRVVPRRSPRFLRSLRGRADAPLRRR